jgi:hypothetical protein
MKNKSLLTGISNTLLLTVLLIVSCKNINGTERDVVQSNEAAYIYATAGSRTLKVTRAGMLTVTCQGGGGAGGDGWSVFASGGSDGNNGEASYILVNKKTIITAEGGTGGSAAKGKPGAITTRGETGNIGRQYTKTIEVTAGDSIIISIGKGGGGRTVGGNGWGGAPGTGRGKGGDGNCGKIEITPVPNDIEEKMALLSEVLG